MVVDREYPVHVVASILLTTPVATPFVDITRYLQAGAFAASSNSSAIRPLAE